MSNMQYIEHEGHFAGTGTGTGTRIHTYPKASGGNTWVIHRYLNLLGEFKGISLYRATLTAAGFSQTDPPYSPPDDGEGRKKSRKEGWQTKKCKVSDNKKNVIYKIYLPECG